MSGSQDNNDEQQVGRMEPVQYLSVKEQVAQYLSVKVRFAIATCVRCYLRGRNCGYEKSSCSVCERAGEDCVCVAINTDMPGVVLVPSRTPRTHATRRTLS
jgi:hypothetical protein